MDEIITPAGLVLRPQVTVTLQGPNNTPINVEMMIDSGSDVVLIPRSLGVALGYDPQPVVDTFGVSGSTSGQLFDVQITVGDQTFTAPMFVSMSEDSPPLLGRAGVWDRFSSLTFFTNQQQTCFGEATTPLAQLVVSPSVWVIAAAIFGGVALYAVLK